VTVVQPFLGHAPHDHNQICDVTALKNILLTKWKIPINVDKTWFRESRLDNLKNMAPVFLKTKIKERNNISSAVLKKVVLKKFE